MKPANETITFYMNDKDALEDRKLFVRNLGEVIKQTRDGVISVELGDNEIVTITYQGGGTHTVNIRMDSYAAIIRDVAKHIC
jgi:hypothetical protein